MLSNTYPYRQRKVTERQHPKSTGNPRISKTAARDLAPVFEKTLGIKGERAGKEQDFRGFAGRNGSRSWGFAGMGQAAPNCSTIRSGKEREERPSVIRRCSPRSKYHEMIGPEPASRVGRRSVRESGVSLLIRPSEPGLETKLLYILAWHSFMFSTLPRAQDAQLHLVDYPHQKQVEDQLLNILLQPLNHSQRDNKYNAGPSPWCQRPHRLARPR